MQKKGGPMKRALVLIGLIAILGHCVAAGEIAQVNIEFLLDASESMTEDVLGGAKIDLATRALLEILNALPSSYNVGLRVFGSRHSANSTDESCVDTQLLSPIAPFTTESRISFEQHLSAITPMGMSPISLALESAANDFFGMSGRKILILLSDGEETCGGTPITVADYVTQMILDLEVHVIGFDIASLQQLEQIAEAGNGNYYHARNGIEIVNALNQAIWDATGVLFYDDFESELLPAWRVETIKGMTLGINDHAMTLTGSKLDCMLVGAYVGVHTWTDYSLSMDIIFSSRADRNCDQMVIPFRVQDANHMMAFFLRPRGESGFRILTNGIWSGLFAGAETPWADNYSFSLLVQGNSYTVMLNNEPFTTWQGHGYANGYVGIMIGEEDTAPWIDNFTVRQVK
jgi:von Willebrand factor type A domain